ncbi:unnamed protein product, partial [Adineta steineri]
KGIKRSDETSLAIKA